MRVEDGWIVPTLADGEELSRSGESGWAGAVAGATDWYIKAYNSDRFEIGESTAGGGPFVIEPGAPADTVYIEDTGDVGMGTTNPVSDLHVASGATGVTIRGEATGSTWEWFNANSALWFSRVAPNADSAVMSLENDAPQGSLVLDGNGVGIGTFSPDDKLHIRATDGTAGILLEQTSAIATNTMLAMQHNGNPGFQMENTGTGAIWQFRLGGSGASEQFSVNKLGTGQPEASFLANGNLVMPAA